LTRTTNEFLKLEKVIYKRIKQENIVGCNFTQRILSPFLEFFSLFNLMCRNTVN